MGNGCFGNKSQEQREINQPKEIKQEGREQKKSEEKHIDKPKEIIKEGEQKKQEQSSNQDSYMQIIYQWDTLKMFTSLLDNFSSTSATVDQLSTYLKEIVEKLSNLDTFKSKEKVASIFDQNICKQIKESYADKKLKDKFHYHKLVKMFKQKYQVETITQEEESRILHHLASNIQKYKYRNLIDNYTVLQIDKLVELELIQSIVQETGQKLNYTIQQLKKETQRMQQMLKQTIKKFEKELKTLKYDLKDQQDYITAAEISSYACRYHENGIYFLIVYFKRGFESLESKGRKVKDIEEITKRVLDELGIKYRPGQKLSNIEEYKESFNNLELKKQNVNHNNYTFEKGKDKYDQLKQIIRKQANMASQLMDKFEKIISECCLKNSLWSKTGLKVNPNNPNSKSINRIIEKMLFKKSDGKNKQTIQDNTGTIQATLSEEDKEYKRGIQSILEGKKDIQFRITDMLRGKCIFSTVDDILLAIANIKEFVFKNKGTYEIVEIENRFKLENPISDFTLKIQIDNKLIAQLQLSLQSNFAIYNFAHKVYEFVRSKIYSKIKTLHNYLQEYKIQMTEMIAGQLERKNKFSENEKDTILNYFLISSETKNVISLQKSFYQKFTESGGKNSFTSFLERFKYAQPLISMVLYRKMNMIDEKKIRMAQRQENTSVKEMIILQLLKFWDPLKHIEGKKQYQEIKKKFRRIRSLRNIILDQYQKRDQLISQIYGKESIQYARSLYQKAVSYDCLTTFSQAQKCLQKLEQRDVMLELNCKLRSLVCRFKRQSSKITPKVLKQLQELSIKMKQSQSYLNALVVYLLISQYYLIYQKNNELFDKHYKTAEEMSKVQGIPFAGQVINDIEFRINRHLFYCQKDPVAKTKIFNNKLRIIISNFGGYIQYNYILQILDKLITEIDGLGLELSPFKTNKFDLSMHLHPDNLKNKLLYKVLAKMEFENLEKIYIGHYKDEGEAIQICEMIQKWNHEKLSTLSLQNNNITDQGIRALSKADWPHLSWLYLGENNITDQGIRALSKANWPNLSTLFLNKNKIQDRDEARRILQKAFPKMSLQNI